MDVVKRTFDQRSIPRSTYPRVQPHAFPTFFALFCHCFGRSILDKFRSIERPRLLFGAKLSLGFPILSADSKTIPSWLEMLEVDAATGDDVLFLWKR